MDEFQVIITPDAQADLNELDDYITYTLLSPDTAIAYIRNIKRELLSLQRAPKRCKLVDEEPWHSRGIRRLNAKGFAVFYRVLDQSREAFILNVLYQRRDLMRILAERAEANDEK